MKNLSKIVVVIFILTFMTSLSGCFDGKSETTIIDPGQKLDNGSIRITLVIPKSNINGCLVSSTPEVTITPLALTGPTGIAYQQSFRPTLGWSNSQSCTFLNIVAGLKLGTWRLQIPDLSIDCEVILTSTRRQGGAFISLINGHKTCG